MAVNRQILRIAIPSIVSNITVPLLGLVDAGITGHLGGGGYLAAIAVGGMLFNVIYWLFSFLRMGTSGMTAQAYGAEDHKEIGDILARSMITAIAISVIAIILQIPVRELALLLIRPSAEVAQLTRTYFSICIWGAPSSLMLFVMSGWFIGMQNSRAPMFVAIFQNVANIVLSFVFVYLMKMKIDGVAMGTMMAQNLGFIAAIVILYRQYPEHFKSLLVFRMTETWRHGWKRALHTFSVNINLFLRTLCLVFVHFYFIAEGAQLGSDYLAVNTLIMQLYLLYSYIMDGFAYAGEALVGRNIGRRKSALGDGLGKGLFLWGGFTMMVFTLAYALCGDVILSVLTDSAVILEIAGQYSWWITLLPVCGMAAFIWDGIYIGAAETRGMLISTLTGMMVFLLLIHVLTPSLADHGLWIAFLSYIFARGTVQTFLWKRCHPSS